ncbi:c-type cytochrome [Propionivibrio sp.]|uniref:c-type cytochrome n=1 Tax=Propionivibrio sp. TaxID=2212460 RepID=UPI003BF29DC4
MNFNVSLSARHILIGIALIPALVSFPALASPSPQVCDSHGLVRGAEIAMENLCFGCHTLSRERIGPPYQKVAARYGQDPKEVSVLAAKIKNGGSGVWGSVVMPPNPISTAEAEALARWILSLGQ